MTLYVKRRGIMDSKYCRLCHLETILEYVRGRPPIWRQCFSVRKCVTTFCNKLTLSHNCFVFQSNSLHELCYVADRSFCYVCLEPAAAPVRTHNADRTLHFNWRCWDTGSLRRRGTRQRVNCAEWEKRKQEERLRKTLH